MYVQRISRQSSNIQLFDRLSWIKAFEEGAMKVLTDPFFWALVSMFGLAGAQALVGSAKLARFWWLGFITVGLFTLGRVVIVLPWVPQPRLAGGDWSWVAGGLIFAVGMVFALPTFTIRPITGPEAGVNLKTGGLYGIARNPLYLSLCPVRSVTYVSGRSSITYNFVNLRN